MSTKIGWRIMITAVLTLIQIILIMLAVVLLYSMKK